MTFQYQCDSPCDTIWHSKVKFGHFLTKNAVCWLAVAQSLQVEAYLSLFVSYLATTIVTISIINHKCQCDTVSKAVQRVHFWPFCLISHEIQKNTKQKFGYPYHWVTKWAPKIPFDLFRWQVHNLEMLSIMDLQGMSTSFIMPFHSVNPILFHWFLDASHGQQIWARGLIFVEYRNTL